MRDSIKYTRQREEMVRQQIAARGITDPNVLAAFHKVPRHLFVSEALRDQAYGDYPLPIGEQQTISQPYIVAEMTQALELNKDDISLTSCTIIALSCDAATALRDGRMKAPSMPSWLQQVLLMFLKNYWISWLKADAWWRRSAINIPRTSSSTPRMKGASIRRIWEDAALSN
jgi:hypothetical protein